MELDALVASGKDPGERYEPGELEPPPRYVVRTAGRGGGEYETRDGRARPLGGDAAARARSATCTAAATASPPA